MTFDVDAYDKNGNVITNLVQWDRDVYVYVSLDREQDSDKSLLMNFFNCSSGVAYVVDTSFENKMLFAKIPNILLQESRPITGYISLSGTDGEHAILRIRINVRPMPMPSSYVAPNNKDYITVLSILDSCLAFEESARVSLDNTIQSEKNTATSERKALDEANKAEDFAVISESWAVGMTGRRDGEDTNNSKYYSEQSQMFKESVETDAIYSKSYTVGGTGTRSGEDEDNVKYYYDKIRVLSEYFELATLEEVGTFVNTAYFAFANLEEVEMFVGVDVSKIGGHR